MANRRYVKSDKNVATDGHERDKDFLNESEMSIFLESAKKGRHGVRDYTLLLMMYRHGLRVSEAITLRLKDLNLKESRIWIRRLKNGLSVEQPVSGDELRAIKRYLHIRADNLPWLFVSERGQPLTRQAVSYLTSKISTRSGLQVHPHTLRHSVAVIWLIRVMI